MNHSVNRMLARSIIVGFCAWLAPATQAAGLGALSVQSALGQPLIAEIEITGTLPTDEFARIVARIGSPEEYQAAKLVLTPLVRQLRIDSERRADGRSFLKITSHSPVNEPTLDLLVEFNWRGGRLLQKYSVLLDPPK